MPGQFRLSFSEHIENLESRFSKADSLTLPELLEHLGPRSHWLPVILLSLPFVQPIPMLGLSTIFGGAILVVAVAIIMNLPIYVPQRFARAKIPITTFRAMCAAARKVFGALERFLRPRGKWLYANSAAVRISGALILVCALLLALPLPIPGSNTIPAIPMILMGLGHLEEDALFVFSGWIAALAAYIIFAVLFAAPIAAWFGLQSQL